MYRRVTNHLSRTAGAGRTALRRARAEEATSDPGMTRRLSGSIWPRSRVLRWYRSSSRPGICHRSADDRRCTTASPPDSVAPPNTRPRSPPTRESHHGAENTREINRREQRLRQPQASTTDARCTHVTITGTSRRPPVDFGPEHFENHSQGHARMGHHRTCTSPYAKWSSKAGVATR